MADLPYSIVEYCGYQTQRECGYCNRPDTNCNHGMWAYYLTVQDYQDLIDRGWRRSGCYCYKPTMGVTCCPMYTIRCNTLKFKITKSQRKVLKRMAKFLRNEFHKGDVPDNSRIEMPDNIDMSRAEGQNREKHRADVEKYVSEMNVQQIESEFGKRSDANCDNTEKPNHRKSREKTRVADESRRNEGARSEDGVPADGTGIGSDNRDPNRPPPRKAKLIRIERKRNKLLAQGKSPEEIDALFRSKKKQNTGKSVEELFEEIHGGARKLETKLVRVMSDEFFETLDVSADLYKKYQMAIHENTPNECDKKSFSNFLVKSPLRPCSPPDGPPQGYGSFHEQYWLDGTLIAVAVIDILPHCVSSVYFFYDPVYSFLSLGTFSSLREVCLTRQLNAVAPGIEFYYMGFYIHSNVKMRYKIRMKPSMLLCPETYVWCDIEGAITKIDVKKYSRLNDDPEATDRDGVVDLRTVMASKRNTEDLESLKEYARLVGRKCAQRMLLYR